MIHESYFGALIQPLNFVVDEITLCVQGGMLGYAIECAQKALREDDDEKKQKANANVRQGVHAAGAYLDMQNPIFI